MSETETVLTQKSFDVMNACDIVPRGNVVTWSMVVSREIPIEDFNADPVASADELFKDVATKVFTYLEERAKRLSIIQGANAHAEQATRIIIPG